MANVDLVIFDLYDTLIYLNNKTKPYKKLLSEINLQTTKEIKEAWRIALTENFSGLEEFVKRINPDLNLDIGFYEKELEREIKSASIYPETKDVLRKLKNKKIRLGLISNLASPYKKPFFDLDLNKYFDNILLSCDIGMRKPELDIYKKMIKLSGVNPNKSLMIGDKIREDVETPKSIGINAVHIDRANNSKDSISSLEEVFQYL